jgi:hypothetical protein
VRVLRSLQLVGVVVVVALAAVSTAAAGRVPPPPTVTCPNDVYSQPFMPFGDSALYSVVPGGSFEPRTGGWSLGGSAKIVSGNESYFVNSAKDRYSLQLGAGASATSPVFCTALTYPTMRFFLTNGGSTSATLHVDVLYKDPTGASRSLTIARLTAGAAWTPSPTILLLANAQAAASPDGTTPLQLRFTADPGSSFRIDDVYVDPMKQR